MVSHVGREPLPDALLLVCRRQEGLELRELARELAEGVEVLEAEVVDGQRLDDVAAEVHVVAADLDAAVALLKTGCISDNVGWAAAVVVQQ